MCAAAADQQIRTARSPGTIEAQKLAISTPAEGEAAAATTKEEAAVAVAQEEAPVEGEATTATTEGKPPPAEEKPPTTAAVEEPATAAATPVDALQTAGLTDTAAMIAAEFSTGALQAAELVDTAAMMAAERIPAALQTANLTDTVVVMTTEFPTVVSQPMDHDLGRRSGSTQAVSKLRQTKYGHRGDAHNGEESHPGAKRTSNTDEPDADASWACSKCTLRNNEFLRSCEMCAWFKRLRRTETGVSAAAPAAALAKVHLSPVLPDIKPLVGSSPTGMSAAPAEVKEICLPAPAQTNVGFSVEETNGSIRVSLLEDQEVTEFNLKRHKLLGDNLSPPGLYIIDVPSDGSCQFTALELGLATLVEDPPASDQGVRDQIVDYLLANRELLEKGQQTSFQYSDSVFKEAVLSAYDDTYTYDMYCALVRNPVGVKASGEGGDALTRCCNESLIGQCAGT